jgi:hypothetical protein
MEKERSPDLGRVRDGGRTNAAEMQGVVTQSAPGGWGRPESTVTNS